jgi:hypothetical protein
MPARWEPAVGRWLLGEAITWDARGKLAKASPLSILFVFLALAAGGMGGTIVRAEDTCLPAPTGKTPPGSHWHYRTDPVKQTKCWYLRSDAAQPAAATDNPDAAAASAKPVAAPKPAPDAVGAEPHPHKPHQATRAGAGAKTPQGGAQNTAPAGVQNPPAAGAPAQGVPANGPPASQATGGSAPPWPDPQAPSAQGAAGNRFSWPEPPSATTGAAPDAPAANTAQEPAAAVQETGSVNATGASDAPAADATAAPASQNSDVSGSTILAVAIAMAFIGILMRWLVGKFFARRRKAAAERREPLWVTDEYVMPDALTRGTRQPPGRIDPERLDDEVKQALKKLLRTLERSAA